MSGNIPEKLENKNQNTEIHFFYPNITLKVQATNKISPEKNLL
jgi:hypothetical protein